MTSYFKTASFLLFSSLSGRWDLGVNYSSLWLIQFYKRWSFLCWNFKSRLENAGSINPAALEKPSSSCRGIKHPPGRRRRIGRSQTSAISTFQGYVRWMECQSEPFDITWRCNGSIERTIFAIRLPSSKTLRNDINNQTQRNTWKSSMKKDEEYKRSSTILS